MLVCLHVHIKQESALERIVPTKAFGVGDREHKHRRPASCIEEEDMRAVCQTPQRFQEHLSDP